MSHTKGPWFNSDNMWAGITTMPNGYGLLIAEVTQLGSEKQQRANARLIASAPDTFEACEKLCLLLSEIRPSIKLESSSQWERLELAHNEAVAALAKARGGK